MFTILSSKHIFCGRQDERYFCPFQIEPQAEEEYLYKSNCSEETTWLSIVKQWTHIFIFNNEKLLHDFHYLRDRLISGCRLTWKLGNFSNDKGNDK